MNNIEKLLRAYGYNTKLKEIKIFNNELFQVGNKKWIANILPSELLSKDLKTAIESIMCLVESEISYTKIPNEILPPNYGDNWGRMANYIEINNRAIAEMRWNLTRRGLISSIKLLPAIPPSPKSWANCIILSQIFQNIYGDGINKLPNEENSIYGIKLNCNYSRNIIDLDILDKISALEQFKAFNDLAHLRGLKTGFRTVISADQIKVAINDNEDEVFHWDNPEHQELFIDEHVKLIKTGFESIFIDSAKHIGGYDMEHYTGVGKLPEYEQMQYILHEIRKRTGKTTLSFVGEKSTEDFARYENLGLTTGTAFISPDNYDEVKSWANKLKYNRNYAPGVEVSNDNDTGGRSYEDRLNRINSSIFGYEFPSDKLPSFMQMEDLFPLRYDTNTHHLMMCNPSYSTDGTPESHWENLFTKEDGREYNKKVAELFGYVMNL